MKKLLAAAAIAALTVSASLALAAGPAKVPGGYDAVRGKTADGCATQSGDNATVTGEAAASSSTSLNKLLGGLSHGTERTAGAGATSSADAAAADKTGCGDGGSQSANTAQSGVALTVQGNNFTANSASN